jgi:hypothetical protein
MGLSNTSDATFQEGFLAALQYLDFNGHSVPRDVQEIQGYLVLSLTKADDLYYV